MAMAEHNQEFVRPRRSYSNRRYTLASEARRRTPTYHKYSVVSIKMPVDSPVYKAMQKVAAGLNKEGAGAKPGEQLRASFSFWLAMVKENMGKTAFTPTHKKDLSKLLASLEFRNHFLHIGKSGEKGAEAMLTDTRKIAKACAFLAANADKPSMGTSAIGKSLRGQGISLRPKQILLALGHLRNGRFHLVTGIVEKPAKRGSKRK